MTRLVWTREAPRVRGYYWACDVLSDGSRCAPIVVLVEIECDEVMAYRCGWRSPEIVSRLREYEWAGPLTAPEEPSDA